MTCFLDQVPTASMIQGAVLSADKGNTTVFVVDIRNVNIVDQQVKCHETVNTTPDGMEEKYKHDQPLVNTRSNKLFK